MLSEIAATVEYHTLTCSLLAKTLNKSERITEADMLASLKRSKLDDRRWRKVRSLYNLDYIPKSVLAHLQTAFDFSDLPDQIKRILGYFCFVENGLTKEYANYLFTEDEWEAIYDSISMGWLIRKEVKIRELKGSVQLFPEEDNDYLSELSGYSSPADPRILPDVIHNRVVFTLHPVIRAICLLDENTRPSWKNSQDFIQRFITRFFDEGWTDRTWEGYAHSCFDFYYFTEKIIDFDVMRVEAPECAGLVYLHHLDEKRLKAAMECIRENSSIFAVFMEKVQEYKIFTTTMKTVPHGYELTRIQFEFWKLIIYNSMRAMYYWEYKGGHATTRFSETFIRNVYLGDRKNFEVPDYEFVDYQNTIEEDSCIRHLKGYVLLNDIDSILNITDTMMNERRWSYPIDDYQFAVLEHHVFALVHSNKHLDALTVLLNVIEEMKMHFQFISPNENEKGQAYVQRIKNAGAFELQVLVDNLVDVMALSEIAYWISTDSSQLAISQELCEECIIYYRMLEYSYTTLVDKSIQVKLDWAGRIRAGAYTYPSIDETLLY